MRNLSGGDEAGVESGEGALIVSLDHERVRQLRVEIAGPELRLNPKIPKKITKANKQPNP